MRHAGLFGLIIAAAFCASPSISLAQNEDLEEIRRQLIELRNEYENRIRVLEDHLRAVEMQVRSSEPTAMEGLATAQGGESMNGQPESAAPTIAQTSSAENALNPAISVILNGTWGRSKYDGVGQITGFQADGSSEITPRGPSLGESELFLAANVDPYFRGAVTVALSPENEIEVEEAFFETLSLGGGFTLKGGRFFSGIGYWNSSHPHTWDFTDAALVQRAFFGNNYGDDGLQLRWVAPLPLFVQLGAEIGRGREFAGAGEVERNSNGADSWALFAKIGGDIGASYSWQLGASHMHQRTNSEGVPLFDYDDRTGVRNLFVGRQRIWGADLVVKWAPDGNSRYTNFQFVTEYYERKLDGELTYDTTGLSETGAVTATQSGWFVQGAYQFHPYWRAGLRYDRLSSGRVNLNANSINIPVPQFDPARWTVMADFNPSEFSRLRLQFSEDRTRQDADTGQTVSNNIAFVQYIFSLGVHGAHRF
jgi:hypothetical protein